MSSTFAHYQAIIPGMFIQIPKIKYFVTFLSSWGMMLWEGEDAYFKVTHCDSGTSHLTDALFDDSDIESLLNELIEDNKICLIHESSCDSGGDDASYIERPEDWVMYTANIPTLVLQELIALRLEG